jgi:hypothetical protein
MGDKVSDHSLERVTIMVVITFPDSDTQKKALGFLLADSLARY